MQEITIFQILCFFMIYSTIGWALEVSYQALTKGLVINRGFLCGPICPIYGFGVVSILLLLQAISKNHPEAVHAAGVFVIGVVLTTSIELFGGWILDKIFHARWWDYRDQKFNLNGYICPYFSMLWGGCILIVVRIMHPFIRGLVAFLPENTAAWIAIAVVYLIFAADIVISVMTMIGLNKRLAELDEIRKKMRIVSDHVSTKIGEETLEGVEKAEQLKQEISAARDAISDGIDEKQKEMQDKAHELKVKYEEQKTLLFDRVKAHKFVGWGRVFFGNPTFYHRDFAGFIEELRHGREAEVKWLFFDLGSTLVDETACYESRINYVVTHSDVAHDVFMNKVYERAGTCQTAIRTVAKECGVELPAWNHSLEKLYPDVESVLRQLAVKYRLGIIANQDPGTVERLERWNIAKYFAVVVSSAEEGVAKPDSKIFDIAFERAGCKPEEAVMIGDRLDNDIAPAKKLGMQTVWIRQGMISVYQEVQDQEEQPDFMIEDINGLLQIF